MKLTNYMKQSLSRQVLSLLGISFLVFFIGVGILFYIQYRVHGNYIEQREKIEAKQQAVSYIYEEFSAGILVTDDTLTARVPENDASTSSFQNEMDNQMDALRKLIEKEEELQIYDIIHRFSSFYFSNLIPEMKAQYEASGDPSVDFQDVTVIDRTDEFLRQIIDYRTQLDGQLEENAETYNTNLAYIQYALLGLSLLFLILLIVAMRIFLKRIGNPLKVFTSSANEIAAGRDAAIQMDPNRTDELGTLSLAFQKMLASIRDKEQDLIAHNEELIAQQDELVAQQQELEATLTTLTDREQKLLNRNQLINSISSSLQKEDVLQSIVEAMCTITKSDKGIITYLDEATFASFGISQSGVQQFRDNLDNGFTQRLLSKKKAFSLKREQVAPAEKGFHESIQYSYDLYLPVLSGSDVIAIMVYSRYSGAFSDYEVLEYDTLSKQIAIYLEKIQLFEQSENDRRLNQDILNTVQEGIQFVDRNKAIMHVNQQLTDLFLQNHDRTVLMGQEWEQWSHMMANQIVESDFIQSMETLMDYAMNTPDEEHSFIYNMKGSKQTIKVYCRTLETNDQGYGWVLVHRDITREYELAKMKSELVSTVSHELRTPLASVLGFTELLLTKELKPERKTKYLQTIYNEAQRLTALINDFLDVQRMESGKQTYEKKYVNLTSILKQVVDMQEFHTSIHPIKLSVETNETIIIGDHNKMEQVFTNLVGNAIKYSPDGGPILVKVFEKDGMVTVEVTDEGLGIPEEAIPHLFQQFYRVDNSDRRKIGGTGLGLAIVQEIVKAHRGKISVQSILGKGSTFTVQIPKINVTKESEQEIPLDPSTLHYKIVIVEDDVSLSELLKNELQACGLQVFSFRNGKEALEQIRQEAPDAVVLDILLEDGIDGWTIMKEMRENEKLKSIPIFISSALDEKEHGLSLGAQDYLVKPYKPSQLSKLITQTLMGGQPHVGGTVPHYVN